MARLAATTDADHLVARHTILHNFPTLFRTDSRVVFWAGKREFHGQTPPSRLSAWPKVRRVRQEQWRVGCLAEAAGDAGAGADVVRALLASSPLTDLLNPLRIEPRFDLGRLGRVLVEPEVCRMVAYRYLEDGLDKVGAPITQALLALISTRQAGGVEAVELALAFLAHLHLCVVQGVASSRSPSVIAAEALRIAGRNEGPQRDFVGLFAALHRVSPMLAAPADVRRDADLARRVDEYATACANACGVARVRELGATIGRALGHLDVEPLPSSPPHQASTTSATAAPLAAADLG